MQSFTGLPSMVRELLGGGGGSVPYGASQMQSNLGANFLGEIVTSHKLFWIAWKTDGSK